MHRLSVLIFIMRDDGKIFCTDRFRWLPLFCVWFCAVIDILSSIPQMWRQIEFNRVGTIRIRFNALTVLPTATLTSERSGITVMVICRN